MLNPSGIRNDEPPSDDRLPATATNGRDEVTPAIPAPRGTGTKVLLNWVPALLWLALILFASADSFSSSHTSRFIEPALRWLFPQATPWRIMEIHALIRKGAHLTEYAILAVLACRALWNTPWFGGSRGDAASPPWRWQWGPAIGALLVAAACAFVDEWHQGLVPSRTSSLRDVMLDVGGAALALCLLRTAFALRAIVAVRLTRRT